MKQKLEDINLLQLVGTIPDQERTFQSLKNLCEQYYDVAFNQKPAEKLVEAWEDEQEGSV